MNGSIDNQNLSVVHSKVLRTVLIFWLIGWFLKVDFFTSYIFREVIDFPYWITFFPAFFRDPLVLEFFYGLPLIAVWYFWKPVPIYARLSAWVMVISSAVLLLHQDTHNDATFLTSFWVSVWCLWFVYQGKRLSREIFIHAKSLALCVIAVVFMGGFIGKLTSEYWDGSAFADIFMLQNYGWIGQWVRAHFSEPSIRMGFSWLSKFMILGEGILATAPFWPYRFILVLGIMVMVSISFFTTWLIFSVLSCLIGLLYACRYFPRSNACE